MKTKKQIIEKLLSKRSANEYGISNLFTIDSLFNDELTDDVEIEIGESRLLQLAIIQPGDEQVLIRVYLMKPGQPEVTILYDQCQFSNLDRTAHKLCESVVYLYG